MSDLITRITAAHQMAIGQMENAARQDEHIRWKTMVRLLEDTRDEITRLGTFERMMAASAQAPASSNTLTLKGKAAA